MCIEADTTRWVHSPGLGCGLSCRVFRNMRNSRQALVEADLHDLVLGDLDFDLFLGIAVGLGLGNKGWVAS